jgi:hypothetical protein
VSQLRRNIMAFVLMGVAKFCVAVGLVKGANLGTWFI